MHQFRTNFSRIRRINKAFLTLPTNALRFSAWSLEYISKKSLLYKQLTFRSVWFQQLPRVPSISCNQIERVSNDLRFV